MTNKLTSLFRLCIILAGLCIVSCSTTSAISKTSSSVPTRSEITYEDWIDVGAEFRASGVAYDKTTAKDRGDLDAFTQASRSIGALASSKIKHALESEQLNGFINDGTAQRIAKELLSMEYLQGFKAYKERYGSRKLSNGLIEYHYEGMYKFFLKDKIIPKIIDVSKKVALENIKKEVMVSTNKFDKEGQELVNKAKNALDNMNTSEWLKR